MTPQVSESQRHKRRAPPSPHTNAIIRLFRKEIDRHRLFVAEAAYVAETLEAVTVALRDLASDGWFMTLLRAEQMRGPPSVLLAPGRQTGARPIRAVNVHPKAQAGVRDHRPVPKALCPEARTLLGDGCPIGTFRALARMRPHRQMEAVSFLRAQRNYMEDFAEALLFGCAQDELFARRQTQAHNHTRARARAMEQELSHWHGRVGQATPSYGMDHLRFAVASCYLRLLIDNQSVLTWLTENRPAHLTLFGSVTKVTAPG